MNTRLNILIVILLSVFCLTCADDDEVVVNETPGDAIINEVYFNTNSFISIEVVSAQLEDGTTGDCFQITFQGDGVDGNEGPYCPETISDIGGLAIYDGDTNPGLRNIAVGLLNDMEADGWDIVDENGNVNVDDFSSVANMNVSNCLAAPYDPTLTFIYLIPVTPKLASSNNPIGEIENIGLSLDGTPLTGDPPSAVDGPEMFGGNNSGQISFPSLDPCGGHPDPAGYYHAHFIPQVMDQILDANNITTVECTLFDQTTSVELVGFAKDGYPIYAYAEMPTDLDECQGRTAATNEYQDGVYHYVASLIEAPNMPPCLKGVAAQNSFRFQ